MQSEPTVVGSVSLTARTQQARMPLAVVLVAPRRELFDSRSLGLSGIGAYMAEEASDSRDRAAAPSLQPAVVANPLHEATHERARHA